MTAKESGDHVELSPDELEPFGEAPADDDLVRRERVVITRPAALPGVELWNAKHSSRKWTVHHEAYAFCVVDRYDDGPKQAWWYRRHEYSASLESVLLLEPGEVHVTKVLPMADFRVLMIQPWVISHLVGRRPGGKQIHFRVGQHDDASLARLFQALCNMVDPRSGEAVADPQAGGVQAPVEQIDPLRFEQALSTFLVRTLRAVGESPYPAPRYCRRSVHLARTFILEHFRQKLSLSQLAALGTQSPWHFARSFCAEVGVPPARYVRGVRVGKALEYLRSGLRPSQVSTLAGFCDQAQMTRAFQKELGFTPAYFRRGERAHEVPTLR